MVQGKDRSPSEELGREQLLQLYRQMVTIRQFEEQVMNLYNRTLIPGIAHVSIGQEAVPVGVCSALRPDDYITSTHRGHGHCLAKGARVDRMFAELFGKVDGYCRGKGGSMHIADPEVGNLGANAIVGGSLAIAAGAALSARMRDTNQVSACFFGDGASNQGLLFESMNLASIWQLPVVYVCENNQYGQYTRVEKSTAGDLVARGEVFEIPSSRVDGNDVLKVYDSMTEAVERGRSGRGPSFLICDTYRYYGHGMSDPDRPYRTREEENDWRENRDPIDRFARLLIDKGHADRAGLDALDAEVAQEMLDGIEFAKQSPYPAAEEVTRHVYA